MEPDEIGIDHRLSGAPGRSLVVVIAALAFLASLDPQGGDGTQAGLARIGDAVALLIVTDESGAATAAAARDFIIDWGLLAPALALLPALGASWLVAGRVQGTLRSGQRRGRSGRPRAGEGSSRGGARTAHPSRGDGHQPRAGHPSVGGSTLPWATSTPPGGQSIAWRGPSTTWRGTGGLTVEQSDGPFDLAAARRGRGRRARRTVSGAKESTS